MAGSCEHDNDPFKFYTKWEISQVHEDLVDYYRMLHVLISMNS
jgi:hypothetical protein